MALLNERSQSSVKDKGGGPRGRAVKSADS